MRWLMMYGISDIWKKVSGLECCIDHNFQISVAIKSTGNRKSTHGTVFKIVTDHTWRWTPR